MSKRNIGLLILFVTLGTVYILNFTNFFHTPEIQITSKIRPVISRRGRPGTQPPPPTKTISFSLNQKYGLTSIRVVEEEDFKTNKYPHAIWHLISESNSVPTKTIIYGTTVSGMKPKVEKIKPGALRTNVPYVLLLEAGKLKGQTTFQMR